MALEALRGKRTESPLSLQEKQRILEDIHKDWPITNDAIWVCVIGAVSLARKGKFLSQDEVKKIVDAYKETHNKGDLPVSEVVKSTGIADLDRDKLLSKACFNYDYTFGARERYDQALDKYQKGEIEWRDRIYSEWPEYWGINEWIKREFYHRSTYGSGDILSDRMWNSQKGDMENVYKLAGKRQTRIGRVVDGVAILSVVGIPFWGILDQSIDTDGWQEYRDFRYAYKSRILSHLGENEIIKVGMGKLGWPSIPEIETPKIVEKSFI